MFCSKCGTQLNDDQAFCSNCGAPTNAQPQPQSNPYQAPQQPQGNPYQYNQAPQQPPQAPYGQPYGYAPQQSPYGFAPIGMKWFKFLIYFLLFANVIFNIIGGITALTGAQYTVEGENVSAFVYAFYPTLKTMDIIYGISCIALAAFQIYVRFALASYKAVAPKCIMIMYVATAAIISIYSFAVMAIVPESVVSSGELAGQAVGSIIGGVVMVLLNNTYFNKRKHLFVN